MNAENIDTVEVGNAIGSTEPSVEEQAHYTPEMERLAERDGAEKTPDRLALEAIKAVAYSMCQQFKKQETIAPVDIHLLRVLVDIVFSSSVDAVKRVHIEAAAEKHQRYWEAVEEVERFLI